MKYKELLCLFVATVAVSCTTNKPENETQAYTVHHDTIVVASNSPILKRIKSVKVKSESFQTVFTTSGIVKAIPTNYAQIASPFAGRITKSFVRLGQKVVKGSPIFEISSPAFFETGKAYYQAKQEMELALKNLRRERDLYTNKVAAQKELEEAEVMYELKKKDYENALSALKVFQIDPSNLVLGKPLVVRSPIAGEVVTNQIILGQYLKEEADPVAIIADLSQIWVSANVKEKDMPLINTLDSVQIELVSMPGKLIKGRIYHVSEILNEETRSVEVLIECDNRDRTKKPGMYGTVKLSDKADQVILLPTAAILQEKDLTYVLVDLGGGRYLKREVYTSQTQGDKSVIQRGLHAGEAVVTQGAFYLIDAR